MACANFLDQTVAQLHVGVAKLAFCPLNLNGME